MKECTGADFKPPIYHLACKGTTDTTSIHHFKNAGKLGCDCTPFKTEAKVHECLNQWVQVWAEERFPGCAVLWNKIKVHRPSSNGTMSYDFVLLLGDILIFIELDGLYNGSDGGHFTAGEHSLRDLEKEYLAVKDPNSIARQNPGYDLRDKRCFMIRLFQPDVWKDKTLEWAAELLQKINECVKLAGQCTSNPELANGHKFVLTPDVKEYTDTEGIYYQRRHPGGGEYNLGFNQFNPGECGPNEKSVFQTL